MGRILIQIEDGEPFEPGKIFGQIGNRYGSSTAAHDGDLVVCSVPTSCVALLQYKWRGQRYENWYRSCRFVVTPDGDTIAVHRGLLGVSGEPQNERVAEALMHVRDGAHPEVRQKGVSGRTEISLRTWPYVQWSDTED